MIVNNDLTNTFNYVGAAGNMPGKHRAHEFLSSTKFSKITEAFNKIGELCGYSYYSNEGHNTMFYGSVLFRRVDGTMSAFIDSTLSNYGINLPYDTTTGASVSEIFNTSTNVFEIPLSADLRLEYNYPHVSLSGVYADSSLYQYRPVLNSYSGTLYKTMNVQLIDCSTGAVFNNTNYTTVGDRDLKIHIFGYSPILLEVL